MNNRIDFHVTQCPHCGSWKTDLDEFPLYIDGEYVFVPQYCHACGTTWNANYKFSHNDEIDVLPYLERRKHD